MDNKNKKDQLQKDIEARLHNLKTPKSKKKPISASQVFITTIMVIIVIGVVFSLVRILI